MSARTPQFVQTEPTFILPDWAERFWRSVDVRGRDECWDFQLHRNPEGYGQFWIGSSRAYAHRLSWELSRQEQIGEGVIIQHRCDNPSCCNPRHLKAGTHSTNLLDASAKGRIRGRVLTIADAMEVRRLYAAGGVTHADLAARFGVSPSMIGKITRGNRHHCKLTLDTFSPSSTEAA